MIAALTLRLQAAWAAATRPGAAAQPARVGMLNTGELIVLSPSVGTLVLSAETTDLVRDALAQTHVFGSLPLPAIAFPEVAR